MGELFKCICGSDKFEIFKNVYEKFILPKPHIEIVCVGCSYGVVIVPDDKNTFYGSTNRILFKLPPMVVKALYI